MPKLLQDNFSAMQQGIDQESLPQTFQGSIYLARELEINYLWIDALCIIQDGITDVYREIASMGDIYQGALLNIGGLLYQGATKETAVGLFADRDRRLHSLFIVNYGRRNIDTQFRTCSSQPYQASSANMERCFKTIAGPVCGRKT